MPDGRKPDYHVCVGRKTGDKKKKTFTRRVGAAWIGQEKGQINVQFDCDVLITAKTAVVLFENKYSANGQPGVEEASEDIPF
jgi:hypothetical protein